MTIFLSILSIVLGLVLWAAIFRKAGYSAWCALLLLVPGVNLIWLVIFAVNEWPIESELARLRVTNHKFTQYDIESVFRDALSLEQEGDHQGAANLYQLVAKNSTDADTVRLAEDCLHRLLVE